jgi:protein ImuB
LRERQAGVQTLELKLRHRAGPATRVRIGLANITSERRRLTDVLTQKLTRLGLSAPVRGVELISGSLRALPGGSIDAFAGFGGKGGRDTVPQLVERLRARLGEDAVYGVRTIAEHRPEAACRRVHELPLASALRAAETEDDGRMPRPVWLLSEPLLLSTGRTLRLHRSALILEHGPERIESGWWDGKGVARDYYAARQVHGARVWIFQERRSKRWYLHGVFA